ncbi:MAG: type II toxin-antitoxin system prevent-host-death family antitoxin [Blastocatellia bacterium]|nr:type II toxin-antitoxin system prevent-host-death family antitoxin [Blastocatellia bacterium]
MKTVNIAELKNSLSHYLNEVRGGEEIIVRDREQPIARLVPFLFESREEELAALAARGKIRLGEGEIGEEFWKMPAPSVPAGILRQAVAEERDDAR